MRQIFNIRKERHISTYYIYFFEISCDYIQNCYIAQQHFLGVHGVIKNLVKPFSVYKISSYVDLYLLLLSIFYCLWLIANYVLNFYSLLHFRFLTSHNINIPNTYLFGASFFGVHRLNPFVPNLMSVYEIRSFVDIFSIR